MINGMLYKMDEYGDRDSEIEPCARVCNAETPTPDGLLCYQVSYILHYGVVPPTDKDISHRCRCPNSSGITKCCNPTHMFLQDHEDNRKNAKCHNSIKKRADKTIAKRRRKGLRGFKGPVISQLAGCKFKVVGGCFINYGKNTTVHNTARIYVLRLYL